MSTRRSFTPEFKVQAVELAIESGNVTKVACLMEVRRFCSGVRAGALPLGSYAAFAASPFNSPLDC
jgi:hypothetical protein